MPSRTYMSRQSRSSWARTRDRRIREDTCENPGIGSKLAQGRRIFSFLKRVFRQPNLMIRGKRRNAMTTLSHTPAPTTSAQKLSADARSDAAEFDQHIPRTQAPHASVFMHTLITLMTKFGLLTEDLDYHVVRASMVI